MSLHYSAAHNSFFDSGIHAELPDDAVPITAARHGELMAGQAEGKCIVADSKGRPRLARRPALPLEQQRAAALRRVRAEARRRILSVASLERQANDNAAIAMQALQIAQAGASTIDTTAALDRRARIDAIRAASNALEAAIATMNAGELTALDPAAVENWLDAFANAR
jgi:hypothetical protein